MCSTKEAMYKKGCPYREAREASDGGWPLADPVVLAADGSGGSEAS